MLYNCRIASARPNARKSAGKAPSRAGKSAGKARGRASESAGSAPARPRELVFRDERALSDQFGGIAEALAIAPTSWVPSVLGLPSSWGPIPYSEYELVWSGNAQRLAGYLLDVGIPSVPARAPRWVPHRLGSVLWHPLRVVTPRPTRNQAQEHPHEAWFFINGILTDAAVARLNGAYLTHLFGRPVTLLENLTDSAPVDLLECAIERFGASSEHVHAAFVRLMAALKDPTKRRVVVVCHSQGTLIASVLLELLGHLHEHTKANRLSQAHGDAIHAKAHAEGVRVRRDEIKPLSARELGKLELYCFANCASHMRYVRTASGRPLPWIESYGNEHDIVARLGVLAPSPVKREVTIDGPRYEHPGAWGHLLNIHYLRAIEQAQPVGSQPGGRPVPASEAGAPYRLINASEFPAAAVPRLFSYLGGANQMAAG
jgi:hypothetical protein